MGTAKIYHKIKPDLNRLGIKMGRDALYDLLRSENLLLKKRKRRIRTTNSQHGLKRYPNLLTNKEITRSRQVIVSDISYLPMHGGGFLYWVHISDAYSKKILAHKVSRDLRACHALHCLKSVLGQLKGKDYDLIHHSDAGVQYCSQKYVRLLESNGIQVSMNQSGDPRENSVAERIIGIIKTEYLFEKKLLDLTQAQIVLNTAVNKYNSTRPHLSCSMMTPEQADQSKETLLKLWTSKIPWTSFLTSPNLDPASSLVKGKLNRSQHTTANPDLPLTNDLADSEIGLTKNEAGNANL